MYFYSMCHGQRSPSRVKFISRSVNSLWRVYASWNWVILIVNWTLWTNFSEMSIGIRTFSRKKMRFIMSSVEWRHFVSASLCLIKLCLTYSRPRQYFQLHLDINLFDRTTVVLCGPHNEWIWCIYSVRKLHHHKGRGSYEYCKTRKYIF